MKRNAEDILASLESNIDISEQEIGEEIIPKPKEEIVPITQGPTDDEIVADVEDDYEFARKNFKSMIGTSSEAITIMNDLATNAEHPRAFEVLGNLIKQNAEMNNQLLDLLKQRKDLIKGKDKEALSTNSGSNVTNNTMYVGTTEDLNKMLKAVEKEGQEVVDV